MTAIALRLMVVPADTFGVDDSSFNDSSMVMSKGGAAAFFATAIGVRGYCG
jgi:hypothetical protein